MPRKKKNFDNPNQLTVHDWIQRVKKERGLSGPAPGSMDIETEFRAAISEAIKNCELNAYMIAGKMSELTGNVITEPMVYSWSRGKENDNKPTNFPAKYLGVFCRITGSKRPAEVALGSADLYVMESPDALRSVKAKNQEKIRKLQAENRRLEILTREVEGK